MKRTQFITLLLMFCAAIFLGQSFTSQIVKAQLLYYIQGKPGSYIDIPTILCEQFNSNRVIVVDNDKTIQSAIDTIIARADNTDDSAYVILVAPGEYAEAIDLDGLELYNLSFISMFGNHTVIINPAAGNALETDSANANLHYLYVKGFTFKDDISFTGADNDTRFLQGACVFEDCIFHEDATTLTLNNLNRFKWLNGGIHVCNIIDIDNVWVFDICGNNYADLFPITGAPGATTVTANVTNDSPYWMNDAHNGGDQMTFRVKSCYVQRIEPTLTSTNGHVMFKLYWGITGFGNVLTIGANSYLYMYNSTFNGAVSCAAGSVVRLFNTAITKTYTSSSTDSKYYGSTEGEGVNAIAD